MGPAGQGGFRGGVSGAGGQAGTGGTIHAGSAGNSGASGAAGMGGSGGAAGGGGSGGGAAGQSQTGFFPPLAGCDVHGPTGLYKWGSDVTPVGGTGCDWVVAGTTIDLLASPKFPKNGMTLHGTQPNPLSLGNPHIEPFSMTFDTPGAVYGYYRDGPEDPLPPTSGAIYVVELLPPGSSGYPKIAGCATNVAVVGKTITVDPINHKYVPACLFAHAGTLITFVGLSPDHPLMGMKTQGIQPNLLAEGEPHVGAYSVVLNLRRGTFAYYDGSHGADGTDGTSGMAGVIYVDDGGPQ